jgi:hypothetical protein
MRHSADFVNATISFRAQSLNGRNCPVWRKYFFRNFLPAQWNCCGEAQKKAAFDRHSIAIGRLAGAVRETFRRAARSGKIAF